MVVICLQANLKYIGRDALAALLGLLGERSARVDGTRILDIRRHDERALYGSIPGDVYSQVHFHCTLP